MVAMEAELHTFLVDRAAPSFFYTVQELQDLRNHQVLVHLLRRRRRPSLRLTRTARTSNFRTEHIKKASTSN